SDPLLPHPLLLSRSPHHHAPSGFYTVPLHDALPILDKAAALLQRAKQVFCFGQGSSQLLANDIWARFSSLSTKFHTAGDNHMQADRKSTRLNSSHASISYAVFCLKKKTPRPSTTNTY